MLSTVMSLVTMCFLSLFSLAVFSSELSSDNTQEKRSTEISELNHLSCSEVLDIAEKSDCAELVRPLLDGASVSAGIALRSLSVTINDNSSDSTLAEVRDTALPAPFISFNLKPSFFGDSHWGWGMGFSYTDAYALEQRISRSGEYKDGNLGSYLTTTMLAISPNTFYQIGDLYSEYYFRVGIGVAFGYAAVKGNAYLTEDETDVACYQAGSDFVNKSGPANNQLRIEAIKENCEQQDYNQGSLGAGATLFFQGQYDHWRGSLGVSNLILSNKNSQLQPSILSLELAYVIPL